MEKVLSVSIAAYNAEPFLVECVESILTSPVAQDIEVLVINDGSTDKTLELAEELRDRYPASIKIINKENGGWGSTVNEGIKNATGKYFKLLDADDWFYTENLQEYISVLKQLESDLVITPFGKYDDDMQKVYAEVHYKLSKNQVYNFDECADEIDPLMHAFTFKTEVLQRSNMYILDKCFYTDVQYVLEGSINCKSMKYLDLLIYKYRLGRGGQSCSKEGFAKHYEDHRRVVEYLISYYKNNDFSVAKKKAWEKRIKNMAGAQYLVYSYIKDTDRVKRLKEWDEWLKRDGVFYDVTSMEALVMRKLNFKGLDVIDWIFETMKKIGKIFGKDL